MIVEFCAACDKKVHADDSKEFYYTVEGSGPYCFTCSFFVQHIEALRDRVTDIERSIREKG